MTKINYHGIIIEGDTEAEVRIGLEIVEKLSKIVVPAARVVAAQPQNETKSPETLELEDKYFQKFNKRFKYTPSGKHAGFINRDEAIRAALELTEDADSEQESTTPPPAKSDAEIF